MADEWWDPTGKFAPLHKFNPVRLEFIKSQCISHFERRGNTLRPFEGLSLLDIGCGGGLLCEPMARLGFDVTGVDASERNVAVATLHGEKSQLPVTYRCSTAEEVSGRGSQFDVVLNMEVVEHVADVELYLEACCGLVKPGGLTIVATINKTLKALALAKVGAEYVLGWVPAGTHDWSKFVPPSLLRSTLARFGLDILGTQGVSFDPINWNWRLSRDTDVNYMVVASRSNSPH